jgi:ferredoxin--NADP+ reductase
VGGDALLVPLDDEEVPYSEEGARPEICVSDRKYLFLYPMVKQRRWYGLPDEERMRIMKSHIEVGRRYPEISINTSYSFGLDDQEFVVAFEGDDPGEFLDLVQELRPTESSAFTERETPIFTCVAMSARKALDALDGTAAVAADAPGPRLAGASSQTRTVRVPYSSPLAVHRPRTRKRQMTPDRNPLRAPSASRSSAPARPASTPPSTSSRTRSTHAQVDLFDRLPTPFGLVRGGVAPDHPKIKSVIRVYEKTAAREGFRFFGNVKVGHDIEVEDLERLYHAIVYTVGCETDRQLGIPGEDLPGSHAATAFVGWYNAHPDYCDEDFDLSCERAVVIGNGNVAMDVARMLALSDHELRQTDTADHAIERLDAKKIREIVVLGRRGPVQAAFTNPEIKELGEMEEADVIVDPSEVELDPASEAYLASEEADKTTRVNVETLREFSQRTPEGKRQRIVLRFLASPVEIKGEGRVEKDRDRPQRAGRGGRQPCGRRTPGEREELECGLVLRSVGYTGVPIEGVPFDEKRGLILNDGGRVLDSHDSGHKVGHYTAGWIKRGPSGVIGTNKKDALETVQHLLADIGEQTLLDPQRPEPEAVEELLAERGVRFVSFEDWQAIDEAEVGRGEPHGRRASSSSASRRCSARSAKKSASLRADKKLHFRVPRARLIFLPCGAWSQCGSTWTDSRLDDLNGRVSELGSEIGALQRTIIQVGGALIAAQVGLMAAVLGVLATQL